MGLTSGTKIGPYEITGALGAGGMGEVYRARDTRLERDVAIKVLPASYSRDPDRLRRFEQEARAASQLSHPNIVTVHDFGMHDGAPYVVQELLEGETLRERIESGGVGTRKATDYALATAHGLAAAHDKGIVHRDLKPENIFITADGRVKILDFGLAKLLASDGDAEAVGDRTATLHTLPGVVMGTVGYMSPEQVRAQPTDARSDIFSFGAILYEMLTGCRAFQRDTSAETMAAILKEEPPEVSTSGKNVPPPLQRIADHCLEKSPELRFQSAKDLAFALSALSGSGTASNLPAVEAPRQRRRVSRVAIATAVVTAGLFAAYLFVKQPAPAEQMQFAIPVQADAVNLALSADGRMLALVERDDQSGENMLYFERLGAPSAARLEGTEGASYPFWSPDDANIGFFADGKLQKIAIASGAPQVLATASHGRGGSWGSRGVIIYSPDAGGPLWRVNADGRGVAPLTDKVYLSTEDSHRWAQFLPDGNHFLFYAGSFEVATASKDGIYISSLPAREKRLVVSTEANAAYADGRLYYRNDRGSLVAVPFSPGDGKVTGDPVVISDHVSYEPSVAYSAFAAGEDGTVVYSAGAAAGVLSELVWYDQSGKELGRIGTPGVIANPSIAPDGNHVVVDIADLKTTNVDIWTEDLSHNTASRLTFDPAEEATGVWSHDDQTIAYRYNGTDAGILDIKPASGREAARHVYATHPQDDILPNSWTLDDKNVLCTYQPAAGGSNLVLVDVASGKETPFLTGKANETNGMISPDGKWVAYASSDSGEWEIYVTTFPGAQGKWQVSPSGGTEPRWRGDGKEIFYLDPKGTLTAVPVNAGGTFSTGSASPLFRIHGRAPISNTDLFTYDVSKSGKRFLVSRYVKPDQVEPLTVMLNAAAGVKK
jgi:eukaryotic-like serine/threonine-protein kinase